MTQLPSSTPPEATQASPQQDYDHPTSHATPVWPQTDFDSPEHAQSDVHLQNRDSPPPVHIPSETQMESPQSDIQLYDTQPNYSQPSDTQPCDAEPCDTHHCDTQLSDTQPNDDEPCDTQPNNTQPSDTQPCDDEPCDIQSYDIQLCDSQPFDRQPLDPPYDIQPNDTQPSEPQPEKNASDDTQDDESYAKKIFVEKHVRMPFYRKVYATLACQMLVTAGVVAVFLYKPSVKSWVQVATEDYPIIWALPVTAVVSWILALIFASDTFRKIPGSYIGLLIATLAQSWLLGFLSSFYDTQSIFMAVSLTAVMCIILTIFGSRSGPGLLISFASVPLVSYGIFWLMLLQQQPDQVMALVWASVFPACFTFLQMYFMRQIVLHNGFTILPDEYIFAALHFYWDIIELVLLIICLIIYFFYFSLNEMFFKSCCENEDRRQSGDVEKGIRLVPVSDSHSSEEMLIQFSSEDVENQKVYQSGEAEESALSTTVKADPHTLKEIIAKFVSEESKNHDVCLSRNAVKDLSASSNSEPHTSNKMIYVHVILKRRQERPSSVLDLHNNNSDNSDSHNKEYEEEKQPNNSLDT